MIEITLDKEIIGNQLADELELHRLDIVINGSILYINAPESKENEVLQAYKNHIPVNTAKIKEDLKASALAKFAALGLTADEIAAL
jgi:hypothetical protein